ncbi:hypothetical protein DHEL01_v213067 [Diaporthe helianthi]|uniref:Uncharacterized protein n=1 Tax=Diaporthe helianthi TaxID=158607 RepID=A0A2P5HE80_DIAHE|nr:hypothetical protein DHEL01_v213067 [Diaporthe helianthi]
MGPWKQLGLLPLPTLEYGSDLKVWQWRVKLILEHLSLWQFIPTSSASQKLSGGDKEAVRCCAALLASCKSERILSDLLIIQLASADPGERELPEAPSDLFEKVRRMVRAVQKIQKDGTIRLRDFLSGAEIPGRAEDVLLGLDALPKKDGTANHWLHTILIAVLLIKKHGLADLSGADAQRPIERALDVDRQLVAGDFIRLKAEVMEARSQQFST